MTWVVYVLLALNLGLLTWNLHTRTATVAVPAAQIREQGADAVTQLPLLTELNEDALRPRVTATVTTSNAATSTTGVPTTQGTASAPDSPIADGESKATAAPAAGVAGTTDTETNDAALRTPVSRECLTLGPLSADAPVDAIRSWLQDSGATVDVRTDERREVALYWVYFPPRITREKAVAEVERLRSEGVSDVIAVPKGDMANAISLGVFSRTDSRDRRIKEMSQRGYQPSVSPRYRVKLATWIDVSAPANMLSDQNIESRWPAVELRRTPCGGEPVATERDSIAPIAVGQAPSYNASPPAPRRFHFSGTGAPRSADAAGGSQ